MGLQGQHTEGGDLMQQAKAPREEASGWAKTPKGRGRLHGVGKDLKAGGRLCGGGGHLVPGARRPRGLESPGVEQAQQACRA